MTTKKFNMPKKKKRSSYLFNPLELSFSGFSNSGKTTLINKVIFQLKDQFDIGYVKSDVHKFEMDREGKDTARAWQSGASQVLISDPTHVARVYNGDIDFVEHKAALLKHDIVIVEGYKNDNLPKFILVDDEEKILDKVEEGAIDGVVAYVGKTKKPSRLAEQDVYFHRDDVEGVSKYISEFFKKKIDKRPLYGLVLAAGMSTRMKTDKALINYSGKAQVETVYDLLSEQCEKVFVSSRSGQWEDQKLSHLPQVFDDFKGVGPIGGILTIMKMHPEATFIVVACDLPHLNLETLSHLVESRDPYKYATAFISEHDGMPEPLCAIYEPKCFTRLMQFLAIGYSCPRKVLINSSVNLIKQIKANSLDNINTKEEYYRSLEVINAERGC